MAKKQFALLLDSDERAALENLRARMGERSGADVIRKWIKLAATAATPEPCDAFVERMAGEGR